MSIKSNKAMKKNEALLHVLLWARSIETIFWWVGEEDDREQNSVYVIVCYHLCKNRVKIKIWYLASLYKDTPESCTINYYSGCLAKAEMGGELGRRTLLGDFYSYPFPCTFSFLKYMNVLITQIMLNITC